MDTPAASRVADPSPPPPPRPAVAPRPVRRRGLGGLVVEAAAMAGLAWLTYANATASRPLGEAVEAEARGDDPAALRAATEHLDRRPWGREAARIAARCLSRLDFAERAEPYYERAHDLSVDDLRLRAYGLTRANLRDRAVRAFDDVLARRPDDVASLRLQAGLLLAMSRWEDVAAIGRRLSGFPPRPTMVEMPVSVGGHWTLKPREVASVPAVGATLEAVAAHNQGEAVEAVPAYERVLAIDPGLRSMPLDRRLFWSQFGEDLLSVGRASDMIDRLTAEDPGQADPVLVGLLARAHAQLGAIERAEACWRRVLELSPVQPSAWLNLGRIEAARGKPEEAARLLERAAALAPESVDAAYNLGLAYRRLGRADQARRWEGEAARLRLRRDERSRAQPPSPTPPSPTS